MKKVTFVGLQIIRQSPYSMIGCRYCEKTYERTLTACPYCGNHTNPPLNKETTMNYETRGKKPTDRPQPLNIDNDYIAKKLNLNEDQAALLASEVNNVMTPAVLLLDRLPKQALTEGRVEIDLQEVRECHQGLERIRDLMKHLMTTARKDN